MITLQIKMSEFQQIASGVKKIEYRSPSLFNKRKLLKKNENGEYDVNSEDKSVLFINGYKHDAPMLLCEVVSITPIRFTSRFVDDINGFIAEAGECTIEIVLGKILKGGI